MVGGGLCLHSVSLILAEVGTFVGSGATCGSTMIAWVCSGLL